MGDIMYIAVQRLISCQKVLDLHIDEFEPCRVVVSKELPIDIVLETEIYRHKKYEYIVVGDKRNFIQQTCMTKLKAYVENKIIYEEPVLLIEKELDNVVRDLPYEYIRDKTKAINLKQCNQDDMFMILNELMVSAKKTEHILKDISLNDLDDKPNWSSDSKYTRAGYSVERGIYASDRLKILFKMSDECGRTLSNDFEDYCWFIENKRSNGKVYYANRRRRRDLAALKHYETHDGEKKFVEDYGHDR
mgnify:FL=1